MQSNQRQLTYKLSYWERETFLKDIDVAVIGAGIVGLNAAIEVKRLNPSYTVAVFERGMLPIGASTRNAGFACFGSMTEMLDNASAYGEEDLLGVVEMRWKGLCALRALLGDEAIGYQQHGGFELFSEDDEPIYVKCLDQLDHWNAHMKRITGLDNIYQKADDRICAFGFQGISHLIHNKAEGQIHTGRLMQALLKRAEIEGVRIFYGANIRQLDDSGGKVMLLSDHGWALEVPRAIVAVNAFAQQLLPGLDVFPARNQVLITQPIKGLALEGTFHYDRGYYYFRNIDGRILLGGGRNLAMKEETTSAFGENELIRSALVRLLKNVICPHQTADVDYWWTGIIGLGSGNKPIIQFVGPNTVVAVRLSGMGVAIGTLVGQEGARLCVS